MRSTNSAAHILAGLLIGGLAGAAVMLLLAPDSGKETRARILHETDHLRERTIDTLDEAVDQIKMYTQQITSELHGQAENLERQGRDLLVEQLDRVSEAAEAGKAAVKSA